MKRDSLMTSRAGRLSAKRRAIILLICATALAFVACGGRSDLAPPGVFSGAAGSSGSGGVSGAGATSGFGGAAGRGGSFGAAGSAAGGFGGVSGFGGVGAEGGVSGFGGASGFGGVAGSSFGGAAGSSFGSGGAGGGCFPPPRFECEFCHCSSCPVEWRNCMVDPACADITACISATGCVSSSCYVGGVCREVIDRYGLGSASTSLAIQLDNCWRRSGCACPGGVGGAAGGVGFGGAAGFGGTVGFGGAAGAGNECNNIGNACLQCVCSGCNRDWSICLSDPRCAGLAVCAMVTDCARLGNCGQVCATQIAAAVGTPALEQAESVVTCSLNSGCPCSSGAGGAAGFGGVSGFGGAAGSGTIDCTTCLQNVCPVAYQCMTNPTCVPGWACASGNCYRGGAWDANCVLACFPNDPRLGRTVLSGLTCATSDCRPWCGTPGP